MSRLRLGNVVLSVIYGFGFWLGTLSLYASDSSDAVRSSLLADSDKWFAWLVTSSIVVAIGVAFELPEGCIDLVRWWRHWNKRKVPPENERSLTKPASFIGLILVIMGVAGEGVFEALVSRAEGRIRTHDERRLEAADLRLGKTQIEVSGRVIPNPVAMASALRPFKGQTIIAGSYASDIEAWFLCTAFVAVSKTAEVNFVDGCGKTVPSTPPFTLPTVLGPNTPTTYALYKVFVDAGIAGGVSMVLRGDEQHTPLVVFVGTKPPPSGLVKYPDISQSEQPNTR